jgi:DNA-binding response OmpR family regulator
LEIVCIGGNRETPETITLAVHLRWPDLTRMVATTGEEALEMVRWHVPDLLMIGPDSAGLLVNGAIEEFRNVSSAPVWVLGLHRDKMRAVTSLELGADDYARLPCSLTDQRVRLWALLQHADGNDGNSVNQSEGSLSSGPLFINPKTYQTLLEGRPIRLTSTEFRLLCQLIVNAGTVLSFPTIKRMLWRDELDTDGLVRKYVQRLRYKLGDSPQAPSWIATVRGMGYRFIGPAPTSISSSAGNTPQTLERLLSVSP